MAVGPAARIAVVESDRVGPVRGTDAVQALGDLRDRLLPADPLPSLLGPLQGMEDAVRIVGDLVEDGALGTDVAPARDVVVVGAEPRDAAVLDGRHEPTVHLADAAVGDRLLGHGALSQNSSTAR